MSKVEDVVAVPFDLLPSCRTNVKLVKSVNQENDGHEEEQIHRRTDHRVHPAGRSRYADQALACGSSIPGKILITA
ncbi:MAG: hypothetical protein ACO22V_04710, partial [Hylemonella sp.]